MMLRKRKQPRRSCRSNPSQQLQQTPPRTVVNDNTARQSDASTSRRDDASSSGAVDNNNSSALPPLAPRDNDDDSVCSDRDADDINTASVLSSSLSHGALASISTQNGQNFDAASPPPWNNFLLPSHGTASSHRCSRSSRSNTLVASSHHIYDDEVEDHFLPTKKTKWTVDTCPNCIFGCPDCTPDFETRGKDDASRYDARRTSRRMSSNYRHESNIRTGTGGKENTDHQSPRKQRYEESDDNKNQDSAPPPLEPRHDDDDDSVCSNLGVDDNNTPSVPSSSLSHGALADITNTANNNGGDDYVDFEIDYPSNDRDESTLQSRKKQKSDEAPSSRADSTPSSAPRYGDDYRGINYCLHNSDGEIEQSGGKEKAIARSILDYICVKQQQDINFDNVYFPAGTSFRLDQSPAVDAFLELALDEWVDYMDEDLSTCSLVQIATGAAIHHNINISLYVVESKECHKIHHPLSASVQEPLVLSLHGDGSVDVKFSYDYIDLDKLLWSKDTNNFNCNDIDEFQFLLQSVFDEVLANIDSYSDKDHIWGVLRLVPLHLINTEEARALILGRFLPAKFEWYWWMATNGIHPSGTPPGWVDDMVEAYEEARDEGLMDPSGGGVYARMVCMEDLPDRINQILDKPPPPVTGGNSGYNTMVDFIGNYNKTNRGGIFLSYLGESINILERWKAENDLNKMDGAKLGWMVSYFFREKIMEIMIAHVPEGTGKKWECLVLEGLASAIQVAAARLGGHESYRALARSGDGLNVINGGRPWLHDVHCRSIEEIVSWFIENSHLFPGELVMTSTVVPEYVREYLEFHAVDVSDYWANTPLEEITVGLLHLYVSYKGGISDKKKKGESEDAIVAPRRRSSQSSREVPLRDLIPKEILQRMMQRMKSVPSEVVGRGKSGKRLCRTAILKGDKWEPCDKNQASKCEGHCMHHHGIYESADPENRTGWKKEEELTPEEMLQRMKSVPSKDVVGRTKRGKKLCRTEVLKGDVWEPCDRSQQGKCEGHCKIHFQIYTSADPDNSKGWKQLTPEEMLQRMKSVPSKDVVGRTQLGVRLCRTEVLKGDVWEPCDRKQHGECEGHCMHHHGIYESADPENRTGWKKEEELTPEEMLQRMKSVPSKEAGRGKGGRRLCRTAILKGDKWELCDKTQQGKCEGHCKSHFDIYASKDPDNKKGWKKETGKM